MWVVKLGGSLALEPQLAAWLQMLATHGAGRVTVVPGGGAFADAVRLAQAHWCFDDLAAHNMAVLAMAQMALMLQALEPRLSPATGDVNIRRMLHEGRTALWMPLALMREQADEFTNWDVTSDSLALWLARRLHAERLVLVKACAIDHRLSLPAQAEAGVVDARFADWARDAAFPIDLAGRDDLAVVRQALLGSAAGNSAAPIFGRERSTNYEQLTLSELTAAPARPAYAAKAEPAAAVSAESAAADRYRRHNRTPRT